MKKVVIFQNRLLHYRVGLFEKLRALCLEIDIELHVVYGRPTPREAVRNDVGVISWASSVNSWSFSILGKDLIWLPFPTHLRDAELVVIMQENRQISNYPLLISGLWSSRKLAYWGHGANFQSNALSGLREKWKQFLLTKVDWWFAYTQMTVDILTKTGYPLDQVTCLNNSIDTNIFRCELASVEEDDLVLAKKKLNIVDGAPVGIFCGSLYPDKCLDFLVKAIDQIHFESPQFHCIVMGDGPSMPFMRKASTLRPWLHILGVTKGSKKALYFRMADFMLNPGLVGLHIVDAFCAGLIMVTTSGARHSPEIAYLQNGINGIMTGDSVDEYAQSILDLIRDKKRLEQLQSSALVAADVYTLDNMSEQFVDGIYKCLKY